MSEAVRQDDDPSKGSPRLSSKPEAAKSGIDTPSSWPVTGLVAVFRKSLRRCVYPTILVTALTIQPTRAAVDDKKQATPRPATVAGRKTRQGHLLAGECRPEDLNVDIRDENGSLPPESEENPICEDDQPTDIRQLSDQVELNADPLPPSPQPDPASDELDAGLDPLDADFDALTKESGSEDADDPDLDAEADQTGTINDESDASVDSSLSTTPAASPGELGDQGDLICPQDKKPMNKWEKQKDGRWMIDGVCYRFTPEWSPDQMIELNGKMVSNLPLKESHQILGGFIRIYSSDPNRQPEIIAEGRAGALITTKGTMMINYLSGNKVGILAENKDAQVVQDGRTDGPISIPQDGKWHYINIAQSPQVVSGGCALVEKGKVPTQKPESGENWVRIGAGVAFVLLVADRRSRRPKSKK